MVNPADSEHVEPERLISTRFYAALAFSSSVYTASPEILTGSPLQDLREGSVSERGQSRRICEP